MKNNKAIILSCIFKQRLLMLLFAVLVSMTLILGSTYSWFVQTGQVDNTIKTSELMFSFQAEEIFIPPGVIEPGQNLQKVVNVKNTGDISGFVRVMVLTEIISEDGTILAAVPDITFKFDMLNITDWMPGNTKLWADGGDGYYYYLNKLNSGQTTVQPLFEGVILADSLGDKYKNAKIKIDIKVEASETIREKYRDGWWRNGDNPPIVPELASIDSILKDLANER